MSKASQNKIFTEKKQRFCDEYLIDLNGTQAHIRAGFKAKTIEAHAQAASQLLRELKVKKYITQKQAEREDKTKIKQERVLQELARIGFCDPRKYFNGGGRFKEFSELTEDEAAAIASVEVEELFEGRGEDRSHIGYLKKIKFWNKVDSLELVGKHLGMFPNKIKFDEETISAIEVLIRRSK